MSKNEDERNAVGSHHRNGSDSPKPMATSAAAQASAPVVRSGTHIAYSVFFSLVCLVGGAALLAVMLWKATLLVRLGLIGNRYAIVLVVLGLCCTGFLFGVLQSYAKYMGKPLGGVLKRGGSVIGILSVLIVGIWFVHVRSDFPFTIYVQGAGGPGDTPLQDSGKVILELGAERRDQAIGNRGQAYFPVIPAHFRGQEVRAWVEADGFESMRANTPPKFAGSNVTLIVKKNAGHIFGVVEDDKGSPIAGAAVTVGSQHGKTSDTGRFALMIPGSELRPKMDLRAEAAGFHSTGQAVVPNASATTVTMTPAP